MHFNRSTVPARTGGEIAGRHSVARQNGSTLCNICALPTKQQQLVLVHRRQRWRTRRRCHHARVATSMVDTASRAKTERHCPTSALVPPNDYSEYWYIIGNLGAHDGGATVHGQRGRWSTLHRAPRGSRHCPTSARVSLNNNSEYWYIIGNLGTHDGGATMHGRRDRRSTLSRAPQRIANVRHLRASDQTTMMSSSTS
jgi:hypothetical protein